MCCVLRQRSTYGNAYDGDGVDDDDDHNDNDDDDHDDDDVLLCMHNIYASTIGCIWCVWHQKANETKQRLRFNLKCMSKPTISNTSRNGLNAYIQIITTITIIIKMYVKSIFHVADTRTMRDRMNISTLMNHFYISRLLRRCHRRRHFSSFSQFGSGKRKLSLSLYLSSSSLSSSSFLCRSLWCILLIFTLCLISY